MDEIIISTGLTDMFVQLLSPRAHCDICARGIVLQFLQNGTAIKIQAYSNHRQIEIKFKITGSMEFWNSE
jgi:hypothetical protein